MTSTRIKVVLTLMCFIVTIGIIHNLSNDSLGQNLSLVDNDSLSLSEYNVTTSSKRAFKRGSDQKVVAFSIYGEKTSELSQKWSYFECIKENLKVINQRYPGQLMRVFVDVTSEQPILTELTDLMWANTNLDVCDVNSLPGRRPKNVPRVLQALSHSRPSGK